MANKISDPPIVRHIVDSITNGMNEFEIRQSYCGLGKKPIWRIAKEYLLDDKLRHNNRTHRTIRAKEKSEKRHVMECQALDDKYGNIISDAIINGAILNDVFIIMKGISQKQVLRFLKYKNLEAVRRENSKRYIRSISVINGRKSALTLTGKESRPITNEMVSRFRVLKKKLKYKQKVYDSMKVEFNLGARKIYKICRKYGFPQDNPQTGNLNPMYGKSPGNQAGVGVKCWVLHGGVKYFCRSSLELKVVCHFIDTNRLFQISKHRIPYINSDGVARTYCPDIVLADEFNNPIIYEIKPYDMIDMRINQIKAKAAEQYCHKFGLLWGGFLTERTLDLTRYDLTYIMERIQAQLIIMDNKNIEKLKRNIV